MAEAPTQGRAASPTGAAAFRWAAVARLSIANSIGLAIGLAATPIISRLFPPAAYGGYAIYAAVVMLLSPIATGRYEQGVYFARGRGGRMNFVALAAWAALGAGGCIAVGTALLLRRPYWVGLAIAVGIMAGAWLATLTAFRVAEEAHRSPAGARVAQAATQNLMPISLAALGPRGVATLIAGFLGGQLVASGILGAGAFASLIRRMHPGRWRRLARLALAHARLPLHGIPGAFLTAASLTAPVLLVASASGTEAGGQFAMAQRLLGAPLLALAIALGQVALGSATRLALNSPRDLAPMLVNLTRRFTIAGAALSVIVAGVIALLATPLLGPEWRGVAEMTLALVPFSAAQFVGAPLLGLFQVVRRPDLEFRTGVLRLTGLLPLAALVAYPGAVLWAVFAFSVVSAGAYVTGLRWLHRAIAGYSLGHPNA